MHNFKIFFIVNYLIAKSLRSQIIKELTPRDTRDIEIFESVVGIGFTAIERYQSGEWEWYKLWDYNLLGNMQTKPNTFGIKFFG